MRSCPLLGLLSIADVTLATGSPRVATFLVYSEKDKGQSWPCLLTGQHVGPVSTTFI